MGVQLEQNESSSCEWPTSGYHRERERERCGTPLFSFSSLFFSLVFFSVHEIIFVVICSARQPVAAVAAAAAAIDVARGSREERGSSPAAAGGAQRKRSRLKLYCC